MIDVPGTPTFLAGFGQGDAAELGAHDEAARRHLEISDAVRRSEVPSDAVRRPLNVEEMREKANTDPVERFTDAGNARRLVAYNRHRFRWLASTGRWLVWDGRRWAVDERGAIMQAAKDVVRKLLAEVSEMPGGDARKAKTRWAMQSESAARLEAMVRLARDEPGMPITADELDADPWILNVANGIVDLRTGELGPHQPERLCTRLTDVAYDPAAIETAATWMGFLEQVLPDPEVREFVARAAGYSLTGSVAEQILIICYGNGANGKTVLLETLRRVFGDYADQAESDLLLDRHEPHPAGVAKLRGRRYVIASETDDGRRLAEAVVKRLTGGDRITARVMYGDFFEFDPTHTLWMATNHRPDVRGVDHGLWRRLRVIPFEITIPEESQDRHLLDKLADEAPGILAWAVAGALRWQRDGLTTPTAVTFAVADYRASVDLVGEFLNDECILGDVEGPTPAGELYDAYARWAKAAGELPTTQTKFGQALTGRGFDRVKFGSKRRWHWLGVRLDEPTTAQTALEVNPWDPL